MTPARSPPRSRPPPRPAAGPAPVPGRRAPPPRRPEQQAVGLGGPPPRQPAEPGTWRQLGPQRLVAHRACASAASACASGARPAASAELGRRRPGAGCSRPGRTETRGPLQRCRGGGVAAAGAGAVGGLLEGLGHLVSGDGGRGQVPRAAVGVALVGEHVGERPVGRLAQGIGGAAVEGRSRQRMPQLHRGRRPPGSGARPGRPPGRPARRRARGGRPQHRGDVAGLVRRHHAQHRARALAEALGAGEEGALHLARSAAGARAGAPVRRAGSAPSTEGSSTSARGLPPVSDTRRSATWGAISEAPSSSRARADDAVETLQVQLGHARRLQAPGLTVARGEQHRHRLAVQAPRGEAQGLGRGAIEPLGVLHQDQQRLLLGHLGQQARARRGRSGSGPRRSPG